MAAPKRKHVVMLVEEVRRLTAIAMTAERLLSGALTDRSPQIQREVLIAQLTEPRTAVPEE